MPTSMTSRRQQISRQRSPSRTCRTLAKAPRPNWDGGSRGSAAWACQRPMSTVDGETSRRRGRDRRGKSGRRRRGCATLGFAVIDADEVARRGGRQGDAGVGRAARRLRHGGARRRRRDRSARSSPTSSFTIDSALRRLNHITHGYIGEAIVARTRRRRRGAPSSCVLPLFRPEHRDALRPRRGLGGAGEPRDRPSSAWRTLRGYERGGRAGAPGRADEQRGAPGASSTG